MNAPESATQRQRISVSPRSPVVAALFSLFAPGSGQIYNKQLEKAVLLWIWFFILVVIGVVLLLLGLLARWLPSQITHPPMNDWVREHSDTVRMIWLAAGGVLWLVNIFDAFVTAPRINSGRTIIRHAVRWQLVHVLGSQLLGFIPLIGLLFPPGMVAEAIDAYKEKRSVHRDKVMHEGRGVAIQWVIARIAFYAVWGVIGAWVVWWILRAIGWLP